MFIHRSSKSDIRNPIDGGFASPHVAYMLAYSEVLGKKTYKSNSDLVIAMQPPCRWRWSKTGKAAPVSLLEVLSNSASSVRITR